MTYEDGTFTLSDGVKFDANRGLLCPERDGKYYGRMLAEGYDGHVHIYNANDDEADFTDDQRREIADYMMARWIAWRDGGPIV